MYGAFGRDFPTADDRRVMVVAISLRQWQSLAKATEVDVHMPLIETALGLDFRRQLVDQDWRPSEANPMFRDIDQPGIGTLRTPGTPVAFTASPRQEPLPAPLLGEQADQILTEELRLSYREIAVLHDDGIVAGPSSIS